MFKVVINDEVVPLSIVRDENGTTQGFVLRGPVVYNGHLHGRTPDGGRFCLPRVVGSVAYSPVEECPDVPFPLGEGFGAFWKEAVNV